MKKVWSSFLTMMLVLGLIGTVIAQDLDAVRNAIAAENAGWLAELNPIAALPEANLRRMMGVILPDDMQTFVPGVPSISFPPEWDWRSAEGKSWVTSVRDQGSCGSCWAFGAVAQLESANMIDADMPGLDFDLSEQNMVSCDKSNMGCNGGYMSNAYNFLGAQGVCLEACFPYKALDLPCQNACSSPVLCKIAGWGYVSNTVSALQEAVYKQPITCAFYVYQDFTYYASGIYKHVWGSLLGGHAICIVGWSVPDSCFIVKNSWGQDWGEDGYFRIAFSEIAYPVRFGIEAGRFELGSPCRVRTENITTTWGRIRSSFPEL